MTRDRNFLSVYIPLSRSNIIFQIANGKLIDHKVDAECDTLGSPLEIYIYKYKFIYYLYIFRNYILSLQRRSLWAHKVIIESNIIVSHFLHLYLNPVDSKTEFIKFVS